MEGEGIGGAATWLGRGRMQTWRWGFFFFATWGETRDELVEAGRGADLGFFFLLVTWGDGASQF